MSPALETVLAKAGLQVSPDEFLDLVTDAARRLAPPHPEPATYFTPDQQAALTDVGLDLSPAGPGDARPRTRTVVAHAVLRDSATIGLFLGTAIHDTSQVVGAALTYKQAFADDVVLRVATVTKLTRNLFLAAVIPYLAWRHARDGGHGTAGAAKPASWRSYVPAFILGFVAMAIVRSIGDGMLDAGGRAWGLWDRAGWSAIAAMLGDSIGARCLLGTAMAAVGLNTSFTVFKGVGLKPFAVGLAGALVVGAVGMTMALLLGRFVQT
jgi:uncharacterized membrane protein YadS